MNFSMAECLFWLASAPNPTYCYLPAAEQHHDADSWGEHLFDAARQGLKPDYTIADAGQELRAGQKAAWGGTPCHGDVFHIIRQCEGLANTLSRVAKGVTSRRKKLEAQFGRAGQPGPDDALVAELALARQTETQAQWLARDIRTLTQWLSRDVLALAGPDLATRQELFDFIANEWSASSRRMRGASARCASRCGTSATISRLRRRARQEAGRHRAEPRNLSLPRARCLRAAPSADHLHSQGSQACVEAS
jgi:hypothetical protein